MEAVSPKKVPWTALVSGAWRRLGHMKASWFSASALCAVCRSTKQVPAPTPDPILVEALAILAEIGVDAGQVSDVRRHATSSDRAFCALVLSNHESHVVNLRARTHAHFPNAGVVGFVGHHLVLSPDEERFSLEPSGFESFQVDLDDDQLSWIGCPAPSVCDRAPDEPRQ